MQGKRWLAGVMLTLAATVAGTLAAGTAQAASPRLQAGWSGLVNLHSHSCLDIRSEDPPLGARAQVYHCTGSIDQFFEPVPVSGVPGFFNIIAKKTGYCLTAPGWAGPALVAIPCDGNTPQQFTFQDAGAGFGTLSDRRDGLCIAATGDDDHNSIIELPCQATQLQYWSFR